MFGEDVRVLFITTPFNAVHTLLNIMNKYPTKLNDKSAIPASTAPATIKNTLNCTCLDATTPNYNHSNPIVIGIEKRLNTVNMGKLIFCVPPKPHKTLINPIEAKGPITFNTSKDGSVICTRPANLSE